MQYRLTDDNRISITYRATVDKPCPVNMTNHVYFNLDGEQSDVRNHKLQILADEYLPVDEGGIPHDGLKSVAGTSFDFRSAKIIASEFLADDDQLAFLHFKVEIAFAEAGDRQLDGVDIFVLD